MLRARPRAPSRRARARRCCPGPRPRPARRGRPSGGQVGVRRLAAGPRARSSLPGPPRFAGWAPRGLRKSEPARPRSAGAGPGAGTPGRVARQGPGGGTHCPPRGPEGAGSSRASGARSADCDPEARRLRRESRALRPPRPAPRPAHRPFPPRALAPSRVSAGAAATAHVTRAGPARGSAGRATRARRWAPGWTGRGADPELAGVRGRLADLHPSFLGFREAGQVDAYVSVDEPVTPAPCAHRLELGAPLLRPWTPDPAQGAGSPGTPPQCPWP